MASAAAGRDATALPVRLRSLIALAILVTAGLPATAVAIPGDPPIVPLAPADGAAVEGGPNGAEGYRAVFSTSPALDADGELADSLDREVAASAATPARSTARCGRSPCGAR